MHPFKFVVAAALLAACSYGGVTTVGPDRVVITRNDSFLFGGLRKVFVCKASDTGVTSCSEGDAP